MSERDDWTMSALAAQDAYRGEYPWTAWPASPSQPPPVLPDAGGAQLNAIGNTARRLVDPVLETFRVPANYAREVPFPPGSEEAQHLENVKADRAAQFGGEWGMNLLGMGRLGGGVKGGLGVGGGKIVQPQPKLGEIADLSSYPAPAAQAIRREPTMRGRSGRPIETAPLPIGTEGEILAKGYERATGPRLPEDVRASIERAFNFGDDYHYGLRVTEKPLKVGEPPPPSRQHFEDFISEDHPVFGREAFPEHGQPLAGPSVIGLRSPADIDAALRAAGVTPMEWSKRSPYSGYYDGPHVSLLRSETKIGGHDPGEWIFPDAEVVKSWEKAPPTRQAMRREGPQPRMGEVAAPTGMNMLEDVRRTTTNRGIIDALPPSPRTHGERIAARTKGMSDADVLNSDELWAMTRDLMAHRADAGSPVAFSRAYSDLAARRLGRTLTAEEMSTALLQGTRAGVVTPRKVYEGER